MKNAKPSSPTPRRRRWFLRLGGIVALAYLLNIVLIVALSAGGRPFKSGSYLSHRDAPHWWFSINQYTLGPAHHSPATHLRTVFAQSIGPESTWLVGEQRELFSAQAPIAELPPPDAPSFVPARFLNRPTAPVQRSVRSWEHVTLGWPMPALTGSVTRWFITDPDIMNQTTRLRGAIPIPVVWSSGHIGFVAMPLIPVFPGFLISLAFGAAIYASVIAAWKGLHRSIRSIRANTAARRARRRIARNLCGQCAYPRAETPNCPECCTPYPTEARPTSLAPQTSPRSAPDPPPAPS